MQLKIDIFNKSILNTKHNIKAKLVCSKFILNNLIKPKIF